MAEKATFYPGERIRVTIETTVINEVHGLLALETSRGCTLVFKPEDYDAAIERRPPANWPPRVGDRWEDRDGDVWTGVERYDEIPFVELVSASGKTVPGHEDTLNTNVYRLHGPLKLLRRTAPARRTR